MIMKKHSKHGEIIKPFGGKFHRNEFSFVGAPCEIIQQLTKQLAQKLEPNLNAGYVDASHGNNQNLEVFSSVYTDMISHHQLQFSTNDSEYKMRGLFQANDLVLINGNHFNAEKQMVIINSKKEESLNRKLDRLSNIVAVILDEGESKVFDFLKEKVENVPIFKIGEIEKIAALIQGEVVSRKPKLKGLVLAGGKSLRMGHDKGAIAYHGIPQREFMANLLSNFCDEVFLSVREEQELQSNFQIIKDTFIGMGPFGGILSAFKQDPNAAWFTVATDIPFVDQEALNKLVKNRNISKIATCFHNSKTGFPEPLITIWEPRAYPAMLRFLGDGYNCPRKVLINSDVEEIEVPSEKVFTNINTPEDLNQIDI